MGEPDRIDESTIFFPQPPAPEKMKVGLWLGCTFFLLLGLFGIFFYFSSQEPENSEPNPVFASDDDTLAEELEHTTDSSADSSWSQEEELRQKLRQYRQMLEEAISREEILLAVDKLIQLDNAKGWEVLKLALFNPKFLQKLHQLDFTGSLDAQNRPELVPSSRRMMRLLIRKLAKSGKKQASELLFTLVDSGLFNKPNATYWYTFHLEALHALSQSKGDIKRAEAVLGRVLEAPAKHRYSLSEKFWALSALRKLGTQSAIDLALQYLLSEERTEREVLYGARVFIETNDERDIQALQKLGSQSYFWKVRRMCYRALAGIPGSYDMYGVRLTAKRSKAKKSTLEGILIYLKTRLELESHPRAQATLRRCIQKVTLLLKNR